ncbi:hypothetical protein B0H13DRAFT_1892571 [Mycena leptocephala]|nr:hypothetical protein B0H13DRAFT_1892571 [Mycena leptocephala]
MHLLEPRDATRPLRLKRWLKKGKKHQRTMETKHKNASEMIFRDNNKDRARHEVDLHGLFVKEAELKVKEAILASEQQGDPEVRFIVGQGRHSVNGKSKLEPALTSYIQE